MEASRGAAIRRQVLLLCTPLVARALPRRQPLGAVAGPAPGRRSAPGRRPDGTMGRRRPGRRNPEYGLEHADRDNADDSAMGSLVQLLHGGICDHCRAQLRPLPTHPCREHDAYRHARRPLARSALWTPSRYACGSFPPTRPTRRRTPEPASALGHATVFSLYSANRAPPDRR